MKKKSLIALISILNLNRNTEEERTNHSYVSELLMNSFYFSEKKISKPPNLRHNTYNFRQTL